MINKKRLIRAWFYFRIGHGSYISYFISILNFITIQYMLLVKNLPFKFHFSTFIILFCLFYPIISILLGYLHTKKIMSTFQSIQWEHNPKYAELIRLIKEMKNEPD